MVGNGEDKSRIAAQIVSGIGFLGAGAIMHDSVRIRGLTTAAMIWVVAAIGMLCGGGYGGTAIGLTVALSLLLKTVTYIENRYIGPCFHTQVTLLFDDHDGKTSVKIDSILDEHQVMGGAAKKSQGESGLTEMTLHYCNAHKHHKAFLLKFADMPEIITINRHA
jgi:putative Mg2+ transporter-C (MgtC) family protein